MQHQRHWHLNIRNHIDANIGDHHCRRSWSHSNRRNTTSIRSCSQGRTLQPSAYSWLSGQAEIEAEIEADATADASKKANKEGGSSNVFAAGKVIAADKEDCHESNNGRQVEGETHSCTVIEGELRFQVIQHTIARVPWDEEVRAPILQECNDLPLY